MSPRSAAEFSRQWPALERRLRRFLKNKGILSNEIDDLVQEVATRLLTFWHKVDRTRSVWPLTVTIALNLLRDRSRRHELEVLAEPPDVAGPIDAAQAGIAKLELAEVLRAMDELTPSQRAALLQAIEGNGDCSPSTSAEKMLRMRARRRLANAVGRASAGLTLKLRRAGDALSALFSKSDGVVQALACATCLFVTTAGAASIYPSSEDFNLDAPPVGSSLVVVQPETQVIAGLLASPDVETLTHARGSSTNNTSGTASTGARSATKKGRSQTGKTTTPSGGSGLPLPDQPPIAGAAPVPETVTSPTPPGTPDQPTEAPSVHGDASLPEESPVQAPTDVPDTVVEDVTKTLTE